MEKLSIKMANLLVKKKYIEEKMYSIYQYGLQMALEIGCSFITSIIICCLWGKVIEGIIFFVVFIPLRSYLGGFHMKSYWVCYICSCISLIVILWISSFAPDFLISWLILCIAIIIILIEAKKAKSKDIEGKHFYPKICESIILVLIMAIVFSVGGDSSKVFLLACTSTLVAFSKLLERKREKEVN